MYSAAKTTMTKEVLGNSALAITKDTAREAQINQDIKQKNVEYAQVDSRRRDMEETLKGRNMELEAARKAHKQMEQKKHFRQTQSAKIETQRKALRQLMAAATTEEEKQLMAA